MIESSGEGTETLPEPLKGFPAEEATPRADLISESELAPGAEVASHAEAGAEVASEAEGRRLVSEVAPEAEIAAEAELVPPVEPDRLCRP